MLEELPVPEKPTDIVLEKSGIGRNDRTLKFTNTLPVSLKQNESIEAAVYKIIESGHRSIPIVSENGQLAGIIASGDILVFVVNSFLQNGSFKDPVETIMTRDIIFAESEDPIVLTIQKMKATKRGRIPVLSGGKLTGMISEYDVVKYFANTRLGIPVSEIMTRKPLFVTPDISVFDAVRTFTNTKYRRLPVVENGTVTGIITASDILKYLRNTGFKESELFHPLNELMKKKIFTVENNNDISEAVRMMLVNSVSGILVVNNEELEGIITERDVLNNII